MTGRTNVLIIAGLLLGSAVLISILARARAADAQETCATRCLEAYVACYKRTNNRSQCEQLREACIQQCKRR